MTFDVFDSRASGRGDEEGPVYPEISDELYQQLYSLADWMMRAEPWQKMYDFHSFVIVDPATDEKRLAVVMGAAATVFGLQLYLAPEGTSWYARSLAGVEDGRLLQHQAQFKQNMLEAELSPLMDRADPFDHDLHEKFAPQSWSNGVGKHQLGSLALRCIKPGYFPWHPEPEEAAQMAEGMRLLKRYYENHFEEYEWASFTPEFEDGDLVVTMPTFRLQEGGSRENPEDWSLEMEEFRAPVEGAEVAVPPDDLFVARLAKPQVKPGTCWEVGAVFMPEPVLESGRPVYLLLAFIAPRESGKIIGNKLESAGCMIASLLRQSLEAAVASCGYLPSEIVVASSLSNEALREVAESRGITMTRVSDLAEMPFFAAATDELLRTPPQFFKGEEELAKKFQEALSRLAQEAPEPEASEEQQLAFIRKLDEQNPGLVDELMSKMSPENGPAHAINLEEEEGNTSGPQVYQQPQSKERFVFRVDLQGMKPPLWRRLSLPKDATFFDLHRAIQAAFGWSGYHLHAFSTAGKPRQRLVIDWEGEAADHYGWTRKLRETETRLSDIFEGSIKMMNYCYDFGDNWDFSVKLEKEIVSEEKDVEPFQILKGNGGSLIEDCGGIWGLQEIIAGTHEYLDEFDKELVKGLQVGVFDPALVFARSVKEEMGILKMMSQ